MTAPAKVVLDSGVGGHLGLAAGGTWPLEAFEAWHGLWEGIAALHGRPPGSSVTGRRVGAGYEWRVSV